MRTFLLLAAMAMGGMATAQTTDQSQTGATSAQGSGQTAAPGNNNPETDARGIPVISAPAEVPAGANQAVAAAPGTPIVPAPNQQAVFSTRQGSESYPPCTAEVTDNCVQTYEGRRTSRRRR
jgi:hypothetical protein